MTSKPYGEIGGDRRNLLSIIPVDDVAHGHLAGGDVGAAAVGRLADADDAVAVAHVAHGARTSACYTRQCDGTADGGSKARARALPSRHADEAPRPPIMGELGIGATPSARSPLSPNSGALRIGQGVW